jgi:hypothetical protein
MSKFPELIFPLLRGWLLPLLLLQSASVNADQFETWYGYEIHYSTFSSLIIPSQVAEAHGIVRSKNRIVTNLSIRQDGDSVRADVSGTRTNLLEQVTSMDFTEVVEQDAVYYLANQVINERDTIRFSINVKPEQIDKTYNLEFTRQYY